MSTNLKIIAPKIIFIIINNINFRIKSVTFKYLAVMYKMLFCSLYLLIVKIEPIFQVKSEEVAKKIS